MGTTSFGYNAGLEASVPRGAATGLLGELVGRETVTGNLAANEQTMRYLGERLCAAGLYVTYFPTEMGDHSAALLASSRPGNAMHPKVLLAGHVDKTPPTGISGLSLDPGTRCVGQDGDSPRSIPVWYGRGTVDMGVGVSGMVVAAESLNGQQEDLDYAVLLTSDEEPNEKSHNGTRFAVGEGLRPEVVILPDGGQFDWKPEAGAKGALHVVFEAAGPGGHGSRPYQGDGDHAMQRTMRTLKELEDLFGKQGPQTDTYSVGYIAGGGAINQIAPSVEVGIDFRSISEASKRWHHELVEALCYRHQLGARIIAEIDPLTHDLDHPLAQDFIHTTHKVVGVEPGNERISSGGSDARFFQGLGIPNLVFYAPGGDHHGNEEWVSREAVEQMPSLLLEYLLRSARN